MDGQKKITTNIIWINKSARMRSISRGYVERDYEDRSTRGIYHNFSYIIKSNRRQVPADTGGDVPGTE